MQKAKKLILSLLVAVLCFLSFHDYMISDKELSQSYVSSHVMQDLQEDHSLHDTLHHIVAHFQVALTFFEMKIDARSLARDEHYFFSLKQNFLRPPLV